MVTTFELTSGGHALDLSSEAWGELRSSADIADNGPALRQRMREDGYLYVPGYLSRDQVLKAREVVTDRLAVEGMLDAAYPSFEAVANPDKACTFKPELAMQNAALKEVLYSGRMMEFYTLFLGGSVRHFDYTWFRAVSPGKGTSPHCDIVYMSRGTPNLYTAWVPVGDTSLQLGGLMILERSHLQADRFRNYLNRDVDTYCSNRDDAKASHWSGTLSNNPVTLREKFQTRWLTAEFKAGDLLTFGMETIHASLDNHSNSIRLSSDSRYQLASESVDERWVGENPIGHSAAGKRGRIC